jgi:hypothetical protein
MADTPEDPSGGDVETGPGRAPGMPRWVKLFAVTVAVVLAVMIVIVWLGGGQHGPGRHVSSLGLGSQVPSLNAAVDSVLGGGVA